MPTVGWILEDAVERFWEAKSPSSSPSVATVYFCNHCRRTFQTAQELRAHHSVHDPLELPSLFHGGSVLPRESVLRSSTSLNDLDLLECKQCEVQIDCGSWKRLTSKEFLEQFCRAKNAHWHVRLKNKRPSDNAEVYEHYTILFKVADDAELDLIDESFLENVVASEVTHEALSKFQNTLPANGGSRDYGEALGNYALALVLKTKETAFVGPIGFNEFAIKMQSALGVLRFFSRPVADAVSSCIKFNINDFSTSERSLGQPVDAALSFFSRLLHEGKAIEVKWKKGRSRPICPIDAISGRLMDACCLLVNKQCPSSEELEALCQLQQGTLPLSEQDLTKVKVVCAFSYLKLNMNQAAIPHLNSLRFHAVFGPWASNNLSTFSKYER